MGEKKDMKKIITIITIIIAIPIVLVFALVLSSEIIGDWYYSNNQLEMAESSYALSYTFYNNFSSLEKLSISARLLDHYELQVEYLPILLKEGKDRLSDVDYNQFLIDYIAALYYVGRISDYKIEYRANIHTLKQTTIGLLPLEPLLYDINATNEDFIWATEICYELLSGTDNKLVKSVVYSVLFDIYSKLGDDLKAQEMLELSESIVK
jgi:hypothetical protein